MYISIVPHKAKHVCFTKHAIDISVSINLHNSDLFWNHTWWSAQWGALYTEILEVNLFAFAYRMFHEDFSPRRVERNPHET